MYENRIRSRLYIVKVESKNLNIQVVKETFVALIVEKMFLRNYTRGCFCMGLMYVKACKITFLCNLTRGLAAKARGRQDLAF